MSKNFQIKSRLKWKMRGVKNVGIFFSRWFTQHGANDRGLHHYRLMLLLLHCHQFHDLPYGVARKSNRSTKRYGIYNNNNNNKKNSRNNANKWTKRMSKKKGINKEMHGVRACKYDTKFYLISLPRDTTPKFIHRWFIHTISSLAFNRIPLSTQRICQLC